MGGFELSKCDMDMCHGECLTRCSYVSYTEEEAKEEMKRVIQSESAKIVKDCITCGACNDFCPFGANPWDLIALRQEQTGVLGIPPTAKPASDWISKPKKVVSGKPGGPLISFGGLDEVIPMEEICKGAMFEEATFIMGGDYACRFTETHLGRASAPITFLPTFIDNLSKEAKELGVNEIIFTHDACYDVATTFALQERIQVPFKPVHILEYIRNWLRENEDKIKNKLNIKIAYQGGCTTRTAPRGGAKEIWSDWLLDIFDLIGVESVEDKRKYTGIERLCCGCAIFHKERDRAVKIQQMNIQDAIDAGATKYVFFCPACIAVMRATCKGMELPPVHIIPLVRLALGEELGKAGEAAFGYPVK